MLAVRWMEKDSKTGKKIETNESTTSIYDL